MRRREQGLVLFRKTRQVGSRLQKSCDQSSALARIALALLVFHLMLKPSFGQSDLSKPLRIVAFGTSLTARGGWQPSLKEALGKCLKRSVIVDSVAKSGETTQWALSQTDRVADLNPDIILIEFYANDAALNRLIPLSSSRKSFGEVLDRLRNRRPGARIIDMAMNPVFGLRSAIRPFVGSYIEAHRQEAVTRGLEFVDYRRDWERLGAAALSKAIPDGLHPLPEIAAKIITPALVRQIAGAAALDCEVTRKSGGDVIPP